MNRKELQQALEALTREEVNRVGCDTKKPHKVALVYPNTYFVGMSNLGLQIIYEEINEREDSVAERVFLPSKKEMEAYERTRTPLMSVESQRYLCDFEVIGIDITFEMDYFHIPWILKAGQVAVRAEHRREHDPIVIGGGPCATFNPEPLADFFDAFIIGEGEGVISEALEIIYDARRNGVARQELLQKLSKIAGIYVPSLYEPVYGEHGVFAGCRAEEGVPRRVLRRHAPLVRGGETVVATDFTEFGAMYIVEVARGCGRHCRFCMAGYCYRKPRVRPLEILKAGVDRAAELGKKVGLMGAAISDYPEIDALVRYIRSKGLRYSCASLRADSLTADVVQGLADSGQQTITIAPEAGSERLRRVINKGITNDDLRHAVTLAAGAGIPHIRLYIMVGLPTETEEDIDAIITMAEEVQAHMETVGCHGRLTLSVNPFIPKPFTPFQWMPMTDKKIVTKRLQRLKKGLRKNRRIEVLVESPKEAYIQGVLARGDRRWSKAIAYAAERNGVKSFLEACEELDLSMEDELYRSRSECEPQPWDILDMGLRDDYLTEEWHRSTEEAYTAPCCDGCRRCGVCGREV
ncbi:radical SAM protein [Veillonella magna]|uniref:Radical SAM protein n=1 Tax=Veillonella magna TaxID=464322 RepID=A0ABS2GFQ0_9FIRM|nr:radical SAM protein [Veillonella magna]MBM6824677.1 radical SAM protein [Veillonella magna]MBM6912971.1 radical SAM protein [Veillonella magna]